MATENQDETVFLRGANGTYQTSFGQLYVKQGRVYTKRKYVAELESLGFKEDGKDYAQTVAPAVETEAEVATDEAPAEDETGETGETEDDETPAEESNVATTQTFRSAPRARRSTKKG